MFLYAVVVNIYDEEYMLEPKYVNLVYLNGNLCRPPRYRSKLKSGRQITDIMIATNMRYGKSAYIPCIAWGKNAWWCAELEVGNRIEFYARFQSRQFKKIIDEREEERTAYELSFLN